MCSGFLIKSTIQYPFFLVLFCFVLISFRPSKVQIFSQLVILEVIGVSVFGDHCVAGKSSGKGGARCLQSSRKSYSGTCSTIFVDWELIIKCQMSWLRVFFSLSGSLSSVVYSLPPFCVFPGWWCCGKRQRGWLSWIILEKKYHFSEQFVFVVVVVEELKHFCFTFWASSAGPQSGAVVAACILHKVWWPQL